jgi:hypothetical protein
MPGWRGGPAADVRSDTYAAVACILAALAVGTLGIMFSAYDRIRGTQSLRH